MSESNAENNEVLETIIEIEDGAAKAVEQEVITLPGNMVPLFYILKNAKVENPLEKLRDFEANKITVATLPKLSLDHIRQIIPLVGEQAEFESELKQWKKNPERYLTESSNAACGQLTPRKEDEEEEFKRNDFDIDGFNLRNILTKCSESNRFLKAYEKNRVDGNIVHRKLSPAEGKKICHTIVQWIIDQGQVLSTARHDYFDIFEQIKCLFQKETLSTYFIPQSSYSKLVKSSNKTVRKQVTAKGTLYQSFKYAREKCSKEKENNDKHSKRVKLCNLEPTQDLNEIEIKKWLSTNIEPWSPIMENWKLTRKLRTLDLRNRKMVLTDIIKEWPRYTDRQNGFLLVDDDFQSLFPGKDNMKELWPRVRKHILESAISEAKNGKKRKEHIVKKLEAFKNIDDYEKNLESILALHAIFFLFPNKDTTKKQFLDSIIVHAKPGQKVRDIVEKLSEEAAECKNFSPVIVYYSNESNIPYKFYVCVNEIMYETKTAVTAIDIFFKYIMSLTCHSGTSA